MKSILGRKIGMTQIFEENGHMTPVTVIEAGPNVVIQKKTVANDGYDAVQVGFCEIREKKANKPLLGHFKKAGTKPFRWLREIKPDNIADLNVGDKIDAGIYTAGEHVDVTGTSKGKGFAGTIKRYGTHRGPMSHGSGYHRGVGSMGANSNPGRVFKGKKLPGHMGNVKRTAQNLEIIKVDVENNMLLIKGAVPGVNGNLVVVKSSVKNK